MFEELRWASALLGAVETYSVDWICAKQRVNECELEIAKLEGKKKPD